MIQLCCPVLYNGPAPSFLSSLIDRARRLSTIFRVYGRTHYPLTSPNATSLASCTIYASPVSHHPTPCLPYRMDLSSRPDPARRSSLFRRSRRASSPIRLGVSDRSPHLRRAASPPVRRPLPPGLPPLSDDARTQQIVELGTQIQHLRLLENRLQESRQQQMQPQDSFGSLLRESRRLPLRPPSLSSPSPSSSSLLSLSAATATAAAATTAATTITGRSSASTEGVSGGTISDDDFMRPPLLVRTLPSRPHSPPQPSFPPPQSHPSQSSQSSQPSQPSQPSSREQPRSGRASLAGWRRRLSATEPLIFDRSTPTAARNRAPWRLGGGAAVRLEHDTWEAPPSTDNGDGLGDTAMGMADELPFPSAGRALIDEYEAIG